MTSVISVINQLTAKVEQALQTEQKMADVRTLIEELIKQGILEERTEREKVDFDLYEGRAGGVYARISPYSSMPRWGFTGDVSEQLDQVVKYLNRELCLYIEAPPEPMQQDQKTDDWPKTRPRLETLGFTVATWREEETGKAWIEGRLELARHGQAVAYLRVRDYYYPTDDC